MTTMYDIIDDVNEQIANMLLSDSYKEVRAEDIGLDGRAAYKLWVGEDGIIIRDHERRTMDYYGGFEYVDKDSVTNIGDYVFYSADDERVAEHCSYLEVDEEATA